MASRDEVDHPHPFWWCLVLGGLTLLGLQAFSPRFYAWWTTTLHGLPARSTMAIIFAACVPIHVFEAWYAYRLAHRLGLRRSATGWSMQCFVLGYPSTRLILRRARGA